VKSVCALQVFGFCRSDNPTRDQCPYTILMPVSGPILP
jgi:hypothetical protein